MARIIRLLENDRDVTRGVHKTGPRQYRCILLDTEKDNLKIDLSGVLDTGETIATITAATDGVTATIDDATPNDADAVATLNGAGTVDFTLTTSAGRVFVVRLDIEAPDRAMTDDYGWRV